jgi:glutamate dehydrogenase
MLIEATQRTNAYRRARDGDPSSGRRPVLSFKLDPLMISELPLPRPMFEIWVYSPRVEGVHLRGGPVARGGLRWSDRREDFRTEVLGLMKAQMVKNAVIIPVGAKGGFVVKRRERIVDPDELRSEVAACYREFVAGLLDLTDNVVDGRVVPPPAVVRHDGDDPYLVVAADKGTAHLSDTANSVSAQYGFWLGDAFASGGSAGYDHKKMGITARGAWECVKHHFRNLGMDVQKEPFTVAGIGDMAGDVFGNGVLQSRALRLVAAFNHLHIFVDPDPDPEKSFAERQRLFGLARSTWRDYDASLISEGGGIFDRSAKAIPLSPAMRKLLDLEGESASGEEVIRRILCARVDLLYNGGIGTYVKASSEDDAEVGDRANDRVRVDGGEIRARVVAEGGNLGLTQKGRLEIWARGGLINTDALDNSGGVDTSDHEVNIKILMDMLVKKGVIKGRGERNAILAEMTEEVASLVLADNANQAMALSLDTLRSARRYDEFVAYVEDLVGAGVLSRADEAVPTREELLESKERERGFPRPLLAVMLGYTKLSTFQLVMETDFADRESARPFLDGYFPQRLRASFASHFPDHVLRREIVATGVVNHVVNKAGITFLKRVTGATSAGIAEALAADLDADREKGAAGRRSEVLARGWDARREQEALIEIEDGLEEAVKTSLGAAAGR